MDINVFHACNAHAHEGLLHETARHHIKLAGTLLTCSGCMQAKRRRRCRRQLPLGRPNPCSAFSLTLPAPGISLLLGGALYLTLFNDDATRMGWLYILRSKSAVDVAAATTNFLAEVCDAANCFRTDNGAEFANEVFATICKDKTIRH